jgi:hypothetical protein
VPLSYRHDGERYDVSVRLAGVHSPQELIEKTQGGRKMPPIIPKPKGDEPDKPGEKPEQPGKKPEGQPKGDQPHPIPIQHRAPHAKPMPAHVAKLFKARKGFTNYYFNELNRDRVWKSFVGETDFSAAAGTWKIDGDFFEGGSVQLVLGEQEVSGLFDGKEAKVDPQSDLSEQRDPDGSGGLLVALHLWQRLLLKGPQKFGEVYYLGTAPMLGREGLVDVLVGTHDVVESRFFFDPESGHLVGMEMFADTDEDPCEVYFDDYRDADGYALPHRIKILNGDDVFGLIDFQQIDLTQSDKKET